MLSRLVCILFFLSSQLAVAQLIESFNACDRVPLEADCWIFNACNVTPVSGSTSTNCALITSPQVSDTATATTPAFAIPAGQQITLQFKFQLLKASNSPRKIQVYLWDIEKNTRKSIYQFSYPSDPTKQALSIYNVNHTSSIANDASGKFRLLFLMVCGGDAAQLTVDDIYFGSAPSFRRLDTPGTCRGQSNTVVVNNLTAKINQCQVHLSWSIPANTIVTSFIVQKSTDGTEYKDYGLVPVIGSGTNQAYDYIDTEPALKTFYRVRQVDLTGRITFSNIVEVIDPCEGIRINLEQPGINIYIINGKSSDPSLKQLGTAYLCNVQGIILKSKTVSVSSPVVFDCSSYPTGTYVIRVQNTKEYPIINQKITVY